LATGLRRCPASRAKTAETIVECLQKNGRLKKFEDLREAGALMSIAS
jgi:hypothetical protein